MANALDIKRVGFGTKKELVDALAEYGDNDIVVIEVHDTVLYEDLYRFDLDVIDGIRLNDGSVVNEIRFCPIQNKD